jgi:leader peptidase (prepilin peptidase)/N-methyltransferase
MRCGPVPEWYVVLVAAMLGAVLGSFLNVCIVRLPADQSLVTPRSRCPRCQTPIAWYDNVPVASYLVLRGRCRHCREPISPQYPLVEATVALLWALAAWHYGVTVRSLSAGVLGTILLGITITDARHKIIPHEFTMGGLALGLGLSVGGGVSGFGAAVLGAVVGFGVLFIVGAAGKAVLRQEAMGGGDLWMMAMVGAFVGWKGVLLTVFLGALLGTLVFGPIALARNRSRLELPFGVFLAPAAAVTFLVGPTLIHWYLRLVFGG